MWILIRLNNFSWKYFCPYKIVENGQCSPGFNKVALKKRLKRKYTEDFMCHWQWIQSFCNKRFWWKYSYKDTRCHYHWPLCLWEARKILVACCLHTVIYFTWNILLLFKIHWNLIFTAAVEQFCHSPGMIPIKNISYRDYVRRNYF